MAGSEKALSTLEEVDRRADRIPGAERRYNVNAELIYDAWILRENRIAIA